MVQREHVREIVVRTVWWFEQPPARIWPLLCDSRMARSSWPLKFFGLPQPRECRLPGGIGQVGAVRQCISDTGTINQRIKVWEEPSRLSFEMEESNLPLRAWVRNMEDDLQLIELPGGRSKVTRMTRVILGGKFLHFKSIAVRIGLKRIHRFVFRNWQKPPAKCADTDHVAMHA